MSRPVVITCAVTGGGDTVGKHPDIPVTPEQIATAVIDSCKAGAAACHIHVRDPETGKPSMRNDLYAEVVKRVRDSGSPVVINLTTGPGGRFLPDAKEPSNNVDPRGFRAPEDRVTHVEELKPEVCTLDVATMNFGESAFVNVPQHLRIMAERIRAAGAKPELEVFDAGHVRLARQLIDEGLVDAPPMFQLCLGIPWGAPATPEAMQLMRNALPEGAHWAAFGISRTQMPMVAEAVNLGGHVRVGLEDNLYLDRGVFASNPQLVERAAAIVSALGARPAEPDEARAILKLNGHAG